MRVYSTIKSAFWTMGSGKRLRGNKGAQVLALYLMTCSQGTMCGIFSVALPTIAHETGLTLDELPGLFSDIRDMVTYDEREELCWVPNSARIQLGKVTVKDKRRPGLIRELAQFGSHPFVVAFVDLYGDEYGIDPDELALPEVMSPDSACPLRECEKPHSGSRNAPSTRTSTVQGLGLGLGSTPPGNQDLGEEPARKPKTRKLRSRRVPTDWSPTDEHRELATESGVNLDAEVAKFRDWEFAQPKSDWHATFRNWLRNASGSGGGASAPRRGRTPIQPSHGESLAELEARMRAPKKELTPEELENAPW